MFQIDLTSHKSIYEQVIDNMKELIITEVIPAGTKLPSVRELSKDLTINPNTVQKAYRELEREGFVYKQSGLGTFAADKNKLQPDKKRVEEIRGQLAESFRALQYLGLSADEAREIVMEVINERGDSCD